MIPIPDPGPGSTIQSSSVKDPARDVGGISFSKIIDYNIVIVLSVGLGLNVGVGCLQCFKLFPIENRCIINFPS